MARLGVAWVLWLQGLGKAKAEADGSGGIRHDQTVCADFKADPLAPQMVDRAVQVANLEGHAVSGISDAIEIGTAGPVPQWTGDLEDYRLLAEHDPRARGSESGVLALGED